MNHRGEEVLVGRYFIQLHIRDATGPSEQFLIREFSLADEDQSEEDDEHIYVPYVTAQEFWESPPSFVQMAVFTFGKGHSADELAVCQRELCYLPYMRCQRCSSSSATKFMLAAIPC